MHPHSLFFLLGADTQSLFLFLDFLHQLALYVVFVVIFLFSFRPDHPGQIFEQTESTLTSYC